MTTATEIVLANPDGTFTLTSSVLPARVKGDSGWMPVDRTLHRANDGRVRPTIFGQDVSFSNGGNEPLVVMAESGRSVAVWMPTTLPSPTLTAETATYADVWPGVDVVVSAMGTGFTQTLVVKNAQAARNPELNPLTLPVTVVGLDLTVEADGSVATRDASGHPVFAAATPAAWDSRANPAAGEPPTPRSPGGAKAVNLTTRVASPALAANSNPDGSARSASTHVSLAPPAGWLGAETTQYPVYLDPSFQSGTVSSSTLRQLDSGGNWNLWNPTDFTRVGRCQWAECGQYYKARSFFGFSSAALAYDGSYTARVQSAQFQARQFWNASTCTATPVNLYSSGAPTAADTWGGPVSALVATATTNYSTDCSAAPPTVVTFEDPRLLNYLQTVANDHLSALGLALISPQEGNWAYWKKFDINPQLIVSYVYPPSATPINTTGFVTCDGTPRVASNTPTLTFGPTKSNGPSDAGVNLQVNLDGVPTTVMSGQTPRILYTGSTVAVPLALVDTSEDGAHAVSTTTYAAGSNVTTSSLTTWFRLNALPPSAPVFASTDYPIGRWGATSAVGGVITLVSTLNPGGVAGYSYAIDNVPPTPTTCNYDDPGFSRTGSISIAPNTLAPGPHVLVARAFNKAHVLSPISRYEFFVAPFAPFTFAPPGLAFRPIDPANNGQADIAATTTLSGASTTAPRTFSAVLDTSAQPEADYSIEVGLNGQVTTTFAIDGTTVIDNPDTNAPTAPLTWTNPSGTAILGTRHLTPGPHTLTLTLSSTGALAVTSVTLRPVNNVTYTSLREAFNNNAILGDLTNDRSVDLQASDTRVGITRGRLNTVALANNFNPLDSPNSQLLDNVIAAGQTIQLNNVAPTATNLRLLVAATCPETGTCPGIPDDPRIQYTVNYPDPMASTTAPAALPDHRTNGAAQSRPVPGGQLTTSAGIPVTLSTVSPSGVVTDYSSARYFYVVTIPLLPGQKPTSLVLPWLTTTFEGTHAGAALHIFAISTSDTANPATPGVYAPITPARLLDTRMATGGVQGPVSAAGSSIQLAVTNIAGVPPNVSTAVISLTVANATGNGTITAHADGTTAPSTTLIIWQPSAIRTITTLAPVGSNGMIKLSTTGTGSVEVIADLVGFHTSGTGPGAYQPITPTRITSRAVAAGTYTTIAARGQAGIPADATVAIVTVTMNASAAGYLTTQQAPGSGPPPTATLNYGPNAPTSNTAIVPINSDGTIAIYSHSAGTLTLDAIGFHRPGTAPATYQAVTPMRTLDTRSGTAIPAHGKITVQLSSAGSGIPTTPATTVAINLGTVSPAAPGYLNVYPANSTPPLTSDINFWTGENLTNLVLAETDGTGQITIENHSAGPCHVTVDVLGYQTIPVTSP